MTTDRLRTHASLLAAIAILAVAPAEGRSERLQPFRPDKTLSGPTVRPAKSGVRFTAPRGWRHGWGKDETYYVAAPSGGARVAISRTLLPARDRAASVPDLLKRTAAELLEGAPARLVLGPEAFTVGGKRAGRLIARGYLGGAEIEGYLGGVIAGDWAFVILAVYRADAAGQIRPGVDTILASFRGRGPAPNHALARRIQGCWTQYHASSGGGGGSSTTRYSFGPGGRYSYRFYMSVSAGGASAYRDNRDAGTFAVFGDTLTLQSDKGESKSKTIRIVRDGLHLDGTRYIPCN